MFITEYISQRYIFLWCLIVLMIFLISNKRSISNHFSILIPVRNSKCLCDLPNHLSQLTNASALELFYNVNSIPDTTGPGIPVVFRTILSSKYGGVNASATSSYGSAKAVERLENECVWNSSTSKFGHPECINQFNFIRNANSFHIDDYYDVIDIVIPTIRDLDFLEYWRPFFQNFHLIIIQDGDPDKYVQIPRWANYELYNRRDIESILGKDQAWIISSQDASIRNFGFLVSNKTFVYSIDDDCLPAKNDRYDLIDALTRHIQNLITNSTPYFFNTLYDPYRKGSDFVRGYPFSLRQGVPTAISHGIWLNAPDYDAPTQLLKVDERNNILADITITIPAGVLYPMCSMNVAFNRKLIGAAFMQGLMGLGMPWGRYDDMFAGWASKVVADHLGFGVKSGSPYILHNKASNPFTNLKKEYMGLFWQEDIIAFFQRVRFSSTSTTAEACYLELAQMIREQLIHLHEYFGRLATAMEIWVRLWKQAQNGALPFKPSRYNHGKRRASEFAVFTICRNEAGYLPIWLKYYRRYFADEDIYILDNDSNDGSTTNLTVNVRRVHSTLYFDHQWLINTVQDQLQILLTLGYKYVLFCEIDEIVIPDPVKYPMGLIDYINKTQQATVRVKAYHVRHDVNLEAKLNLSAPILQQRRFWMRDSLYDKPLLTKQLLHWTPGFHQCRENTHFDGDLVMFHLQRMDFEFYMKRATWKSQQNLKMDDIRAGLGVQQAFSGEKAEKFFAAIVGEVSEIPMNFRSKVFF